MALYLLTSNSDDETLIWGILTGPLDQDIDKLRDQWQLMITKSIGPQPVEPRKTVGNPWIVKKDIPEYVEFEKQIKAWRAAAEKLFKAERHRRNVTEDQNAFIEWLIENHNFTRLEYDSFDI